MYVNPFITAHNFNVEEGSDNIYRNFQINKLHTRIEYLNSHFIILPDQMTKDFIDYKKIKIGKDVDPEVRIVVGKKLVHTTKKLKKNENIKYNILRKKSIKNGSWNWKKCTAIVGIKPSFSFFVHIWDQNKKKKCEEVSAFKIGFKEVFRILETLEISHAKHFKTIKYESSVNGTLKEDDDLSFITYLRILKKQFSINFILNNSGNFINQEENKDITSNIVYPTTDNCTEHSP